MSGVIKKTAEFLNVNLNDDDVERLREHLSFKSMKDNLACNYMDLGQKIKEELKQETDENLNFIRKGESGGWKKIFTDDILSELNFNTNLNNFLKKRLSFSFFLTFPDKFYKWNEKHLKGTGLDKHPWA